MPSSASATPAFPFRLASHAWWILLLAALALLALATDRRIERVSALTDSPTWSVDSPRRDPASPTGLEHGQRSLIVPGLHTPSFWWIMEAQQAANEGRWRLRHIDYDSPPKGRETYRTAPYRWWLIAVGWTRGALTGESLGYAIERGTLFADPLLLALLLVLGSVYAARYFGGLAAIGFVVGGVSLFPLAASFQPGAPDPHSLAWLFALGSILPLLVPREKVGGHRRGHFILAGILGGLGLWTDSKTQAPVLLAIVLGGIAGELIRSRGTVPEVRSGPGAAAPGSKSPPTSRSCWRAWALAGALTTLATSAFEFAPNRFSWSLDAVNPIQAIVWWGFGEILQAVNTWRHEGRRGFSWRSLVIMGIAGLAVAAWPVVGTLGKSGALLATDFYARELANHPRGATVASVGAWLREGGDIGPKWSTFLPVILCVVILTRLVFGRSDREERGRLLLILIAVLFAAVLGCLQLRWWNLFDLFTLAALTVLLAGAKTNDAGPRWGMLLALLLVLPGGFVGFPAAVEGHQVADISPTDAQGLVARDFSYWLARRSGADRDVILSTPIFSTAAAYYGGFDVIVSADDEDKEGLLVAARMASANTLDEASILLHTRGVTRVVLPLWDPMVPALVRTGRFLPPDASLPDDAFFVGLLRWGSPVWMQAMNYVTPPETGLQDFQLVSYALRAPMENDLFLSRLADFFVERGMQQEALAASQSLKDYPRSVVALGAIARVDLAQKDQAHLDETIEKLIPYLSRVTARHLPADRRISLAMLLAQTHHPDLARDQIAACLKTLDLTTLRTLTPGAVRDLLMLMRAFNLSFSDPALKSAALGLLPPGVRVRLLP